MSKRTSARLIKKAAIKYENSNDSSTSFSDHDASSSEQSFNPKETSKGQQEGNTESLSDSESDQSFDGSQADRSSQQKKSSTADMKKSIGVKMVSFKPEEKLKNQQEINTKSVTDSDSGQSFDMDRIQKETAQKRKTNDSFSSTEDQVRPKTYMKVDKKKSGGKRPGAGRSKKKDLENNDNYAEVDDNDDHTGENNDHSDANDDNDHRPGENNDHSDANDDYHRLSMHNYNKKIRQRNFLYENYHRGKPYENYSQY